MKTRCSALESRLSAAEIALTHELEALARLCGTETRLYLAALEHFERIGVQKLEEIAGVRVLHGEEVVVEAHFGVHGVLRIDPVDRRALDLAAVGGIAARRVRVVLGVDLDDVARSRPSCSLCR